MFSIGAMGSFLLPISAAISCSCSSNKKDISHNQAQIDVDNIYKLFLNAQLVVNADKAVSKNSGDFNAKVLENVGSYEGVYPSYALLDGLEIKYSVKDIALNETKNMVVQISKSGAETKTFYIEISVRAKSL